MLKITGFGQATVAKYGQQFLDIILEYCHENNLESLMHEKQSNRERKPREKKEKQPKEQKPDTKKVSFDLYKQGLSIDEIAKSRNFTPTTIEGHLTHYIKTKDIPLRDFINEEKEKKIKEALKTATSLSEVYASFKGEISYGEIRMVVAAKESEAN